MPITLTDVDIGMIAGDGTGDPARTAFDKVNDNNAVLTAQVPLNNFAATTDPGVGDDSNDGAGVGSAWINVTLDRAFVCLDPTVGAAIWRWIGNDVRCWVIKLGDETTVVTTGTAKVSFRAPFAMTFPQIPRLECNVASSSGLPTVDMNKSGSTMLSTKLTIDANETTSVTAATAAVLSSSTVTDDEVITFDIDTAGTGCKGLTVKLYWIKT